MLHPEPSASAQLLPGYGGSRILLDGALTAGFDETRPLLYGLAWLVGLAVLVAVTYRNAIAPAHTPHTQSQSAIHADISTLTERQPS